MKKILFALLALVVIFCSCKGKKEKAENITLPAAAPVVAEQTISNDKEWMFLNYGGDYRHFETSIVLKDYLDDESCDGTPDIITNIFQVVLTDDTSTSFDTKVVMSSHSKVENIKEVVEGFWIEDYPINDDSIMLSYMDAYTRLCEANYPKPHSKHCVLRKEVGPYDANPQYIFGNTRYQVYVDAVNGKVSDVNPFFEKNYRLGNPLGEWP